MGVSFKKLALGCLAIKFARNHRLFALKNSRPELFYSGEKLKEYKLINAQRESAEARRDKDFYLKNAEKFNYYLKKKVNYPYRRCEVIAFVDECKLRNGGLQMTDEQKSVYEYMLSFYDDFEERAEKCLKDTGEVLKDEKDWLCLPMYKYFPLHMSIKEFREGAM